MSVVLRVRSQIQNGKFTKNNVSEGVRGCTVEFSTLCGDQYQDGDLKKIKEITNNDVNKVL